MIPSVQMSQRQVGIMIQPKLNRSNTTQFKIKPPTPQGKGLFLCKPKNKEF